MAATVGDVTPGHDEVDSGEFEWAASGAMALTGDASGPPRLEPFPVAVAMTRWASDLADASSSWGERVAVDGPALLGERAAIGGLGRNGSVSVGGSARFVRASDGWVVLNLPRPDDVASLPALVEADVEPSEWGAIERLLGSTPADEIVERGALLGLAVAHTGETVGGPPATEFAVGGSRTVVRRPLVVDLSGLWAGPLLTSLLLEAGARVVKIESRVRPDGARRGPREFFDLLNAGKECVSVDLTRRGDIAFLDRLMRSADLVVESSRPRAMSNLGIDTAAVVDSGVNWLSITGHGRDGSEGMRVGFGDDTAVAGGLWVGGDEPLFVADAAADPMTGLCGAATAAAMLSLPSAVGVDLALSRSAAAAVPLSSRRLGSSRANAALDRDGWVVEASGERVMVAPPRSRPLTGSACDLGHDDDVVRSTLN